MSQQEYIEAHSIYYEGRLGKIKKASSPLQPIYESFTNSLEAIKILKKKYSVDKKSEIKLDLYFNKNLLSEEKGEYDFVRLEITDTGIGFDDDEYSRLLTLDDGRKGFSNKGTGRVQFIHMFNNTKVYSVYRDNSSSTGFRQRILTLSKAEAFLKHNAIIRLEEGDGKEIEAENSSSRITFEGVLKPKDQSVFSSLSLEGLKENIVARYLAYFCKNRNELPEIILRRFVDDEFKHDVVIDAESIPSPDKEENIEIHYSRIQGKKVIKSENKVSFQLKAFKIPSIKLAKNELKLTSKGEVVEKADIKLDGLLPKDDIQGNRYLFLLSGKYIDGIDSDTRGNINIFRKSDLMKKQNELLPSEEVILLDDIEDKANTAILNLYDEIRAKLESKKDNIKELQKMFLLNKETLKAIKISVNDTDDSILKKVYKADAEITARKDAEIKRLFEGINELNPASKEYQDKLAEQVSDFVTVIPQQNRTSLTHYVARRKLVLEVFDRIFSKQLESLKNGGRIDEDVMHNLIFQQSSTNPENSDLWLIEEDFIYFNGCSEKRLSLLEIEGEKVFKDTFTEEEERYLSSLNEKRLIKRPDILLFPDEGKCIIIELKAPDVNVSEYLTQIDFYASLIRNNTVDKFQINTFYGYLVGEGIEDKDVRGRVSSFEHSYHLDYWFRPSEKVTGFDGRSDGSIYTEVIKYSTLLERAKRRNKIFIDKITQ